MRPFAHYCTIKCDNAHSRICWQQSYRKSLHADMPILVAITWHEADTFAHFHSVLFIILSFSLHFCSSRTQMLMPIRHASSTCIITADCVCFNPRTPILAPRSHLHRSKPLLGQPHDHRCSTSSLLISMIKNMEGNDGGNSEKQERCLHQVLILSFARA